MASKTIYENVKSDFYSVERAGYTTVSSLMAEVVTDLLNHGFTAANVSYVTATIPSKTSYPNWPISTPTTTVKVSGTGYQVGDKVQKVGGTGTSKDTFDVSTINTTGGITGISSTNTGVYSITPPLTTALEFDPAYTTATTTVTATKSVTLGSNTAPTIPTPLAVITGVTVMTEPPVLVSIHGGTVPAVPAIDQTAHPDWADYHWDGSVVETTSGIYTQNASEQPTYSAGLDVPADFTSYITTDIPTHQPGTVVWALGTAPTTLLVGMLVEGTGIPSGTTVLNITTFQAVTGVSKTGQTLTRVRPGYTNSYAGSTFNFKVQTYTYYKCQETTSAAYYVLFSNAVTVTAASVIKFRGIGATVSSTYTSPDNFKVILEAGAAVDPLNDSVGVFANVATISTSSTTLLVNNMIGNRIYPGQLVNSTLLAGSISGVTTVVSVVNTGTTANVTLSKPQTCPDVGEQLHFIFVDTQPWRLAIDVLGTQKCAVYAATPVQLTDAGDIATIANDSGSPIDKAGAMGNKPGTTGNPSPLDANPDEGFINRATRVGSNVLNKLSYPMNYILTITNRGVFLGVWEGNWSTLQKTATTTSSNFNWMLVQRPVNRLTGDTLTAGRAPVFCINSVGYKYWKFIVREADVLHPSQGDSVLKSFYYDTTNNVRIEETTAYRVPADRHSKDSFAILNTTNQIALTEDSKYLIGFLHNLTTPRFRYSEELDIIGQTSADVCGSGNDVEITAYSESGPRQYRALPANNVYNTGLRICVLKDTPT